MDDFETADSLLDAGQGEKALAIFRRLAEDTGRVAAMHSIAHTHLYGIAGVAQDYDLAFKWFTRAAQGGCPQAMYHLGMCSAEGYGTPKNPELAYSWYRKSAELGDEDAAFRTGECLEKGFGVKADSAQAREWYRRAAQADQAEAKAKLAEMEGKARA
ncbi:MAG: sel1 repeat family protein [Planctomycetota bacterium]|jgi:TPR repeat protein|nr:sel1 repeat family protein [Planctomycetota bacterium]